ncbi:acyltransferase [Actinomadura sp. KC06]|uniref:acyltransferase family protein n=1 Tax=Actinomadura sp. KC06 TaxID=2530369 RepID=UPI00104F5200|nr:acyltransferase [Actinomadura sp. KC06]TDD39988.1 acyltransferase [Actinomadura sp. KC06]
MSYSTEGAWPGSRRLRRLAEETPPQRDRWVDLLRALAIVLVVIGHWLATVVTYDQDGFGGRHVLEVLPWAQALSWLFQVMPVFFLVGGFANAASLRSSMSQGVRWQEWLFGRADRLLRPTTAFLVMVGASAMVARALGAGPELIGRAVWLATIPLWFLAAYLPVTVLTPAMHALHRRWGLAVPVVLAILVGVGDVARLGVQLPYGSAANFLLMWLAVHQVGFAWQDGRLPTRWTAALPLAAGGAGCLVLLTAAGPYPVSMVAVPGAQVKNTSPPTIALLSLAAAQTGLVLLLRKWGNRWLQRTRPWTAVVAVNAVILTMFLWHMTAVVVVAIALYPTRIFPQPQVGTAQWLLLRLPWLAILAAVLAFLVMLFGWMEWRASPRSGRVRAEKDRSRRPAARQRADTALTIAGLAGAQAGLVGVTLAGPEFHAPAGLPAGALLAYLAGVVAMRLIQWRADRT